LNWVATLFSKIQAPLLQSGIFYPGWDGLPRSQDTRFGCEGRLGCGVFL
jgi:hypothetical protein